MADQGSGITVTFASGYLSELQGLRWTGLSRPALDVTTFASTNARDYEPGALYDPGELVGEILFAPATTPPVVSGTAAEVVTVVFSDSGAANWVLNGFATNLDIDASSDSERVTGTVTVKLTGDLTITP